MRADLPSGAAKGRYADAQNGEEQDRNEYFQAVQVVSFVSEYCTQGGGTRVRVLVSSHKTNFFYLKKQVKHHQTMKFTRSYAFFALRQRCIRRSGAKPNPC